MLKPLYNYVQPRGSFAQPVVWRPGTALDLASQWPGTRDEPLSMRWNAPYWVEGGIFHGPQRDACLTFPHWCL